MYTLIVRVCAFVVVCVFAWLVAYVLAYLFVRLHVFVWSVISICFCIRFPCICWRLDLLLPYFVNTLLFRAPRSPHPWLCTLRTVALNRFIFCFCQPKLIFSWQLSPIVVLRQDKQLSRGARHMNYIYDVCLLCLAAQVQVHVKSPPPPGPHR